MKNWFKNIIASVIIFLFIPASCSAFFWGEDKYTQEQYAEAGVIYQQNIICADKYYFNGNNKNEEINQTVAEKVMDLFSESYSSEYCISYVQGAEEMIEKYYLQNDSYNKEEYAQAHIIWMHGKNSNYYYINGQAINKRVAEKLTSAYFSSFVGNDIAYMNFVQSTIELEKLQKIICEENEYLRWQIADFDRQIARRRR